MFDPILMIDERHDCFTVTDSETGATESHALECAAETEGEND